MRRGEVYEFRLPMGRGHEQTGKRYGVVVQSDLLLPRSAVIVAPTSRSARSASFRPGIAVDGELTQVLVEQLGANRRDQAREARRSRHPRGDMGNRRGAADGPRPPVIPRQPPERLVNAPIGR